MALNAALKPNYVSIYGRGSIQGITMNLPSQFQFGLVDQIWDLLPNIVAVGDSVMFRLADADPYTNGNIQYYLVEETKIILTEDPNLP